MVPAAQDGPAAQGVGWLRLAHLSPNTPPVDVYLYSFGNPNAHVVLRHVSYGTVSPYLTVASGEYTVAMRSVGSAATSAPVLSTSVQVAAGRAYTVAGMGPASGLRLQICKDALATPPGLALVRVIQASLLQHQVTSTIGTDVVARKQAFATVTPYQAISPGMRAVHASAASANAWRNVKLSAGTIHTLLVLDGPRGLEISDLEDAAGSHVIPAVAPATGLGGTAPRPGSSPALWLVTAAAGLLLTLAGARRAYRLRRELPRGRKPVGAPGRG